MQKGGVKKAANCFRPVGLNVRRRPKEPLVLDALHLTRIGCLKDGLLGICRHNINKEGSLLLHDESINMNVCSLDQKTKEERRKKKKKNSKLTEWTGER